MDAETGSTVGPILSMAEANPKDRSIEKSTVSEAFVPACGASNARLWG
jgi:hypothetical protein